MKAILLILAISISVFGQTSELDRAIELYRNGSFASAIVVLERLSKSDLKNDARVWNYIGLAYMKIDDLKSAQKALEKAVKLAPNDTTILTNYGFVLLLGNNPGKARSVLTKAIELNPKNAPAYFLRGTGRYWDGKLDDALKDVEASISADKDFAVAYALQADILVAMFGKEVPNDSPGPDALALLERAVKTLEACIASCTGKSQVEVQTEKLVGVRGLYRYFSSGNRIGPANQTEDGAVTTPVKVIAKPRPAYTNNARYNNVSGVIRVLVLFDVSGKVTQAFIVKSLGYGLDEEALSAARGITYEPATRNGVPYAVVKMVEYSFEIY